MLPRSIFACSLLLLATGPARPASYAPSIQLPKLIYTVARSYDALAWIRGEERFSSGAALFVKDAQGERPLLPDFASSADALVSFDGQRVLFAGKAHPADRWQIWELSLRGGAARRISSGNEDCIRPLYLPEDRVVYARKMGGRFVIEAADLAGGKPLALTHLPGNAIATDILHDGRILFSAGYPLGMDESAEIYTVYSDGSGVESYRCDHANPRHSAKQNNSGDLIFASAKGLARFTSAQAAQVPLNVPAGEYGGDFLELASGEWLISWRPNATAPLRVVRWKQGSDRMEPVLFAQGVNVLQPVLIAPRSVPNRHPSGLHDWSTANLLCLNAYTSKYSFAPGAIDSVRMYTRTEHGAAKLLGTAPVERDGSFFVQVPGDVPLQIELLDSAGKTLKRESGFFWMRRGEQRGCVGCHAGPETSPENAVPMILLKSTTPADLTGTATYSAGGH